MRIIVDRGRQPGSVMSYLLRPDKREKGQESENPILHTNMFGETEQELTEELRFSADQNQQVERTYVQYKISFPPGENPDIETKKGIIDDVLAMRGHGQNCQFFAVEHFEKIDKHGVHHLHVLASTVRLDGTWVDDAYERVKLKDVERQLEQKWRLQYCPPTAKGTRINTSIKEVKLREQGQMLTKDTLRTALDEALADHPSMPLLMTRIKAKGYTMHFHEFGDGKGISFGAEGKHFKGRQLGDRYSFNGLHEYAGVDYQPQRDDPMLRQLNEMSAEKCQAILAQLNYPDPGPGPLPKLERSQSEEEINQQIELWEATQLIQDIWEHSRAVLPNLKAATFKGGYQIQSGSSGYPELYRTGEKLLRCSEKGYQSTGLTPTDIQQLQAWRRLIMQQFEEWRLQEAARKKQKEQEKLQNQQPPTKSGKLAQPKKSQGLEL